MNIKRFLIETLLARSYYSARLATAGWFSITARNKPLLLIYQMGKVGSTTVEESLEAANLDYMIFHIHVLTRQGIAREEKNYFGDTTKLRRKSLWPRTKHLYASKFLSSRLQRAGNHRRMLKVITLVRDPIARNISAFFQTLERTAPDLLRKSPDPAQQVAGLAEMFLSNLDESFDASYRYPFDWFDSELKQAFEIDVFATDFPRDNGFHLYSSRTADVLLLKLERMETDAAAAFSNFLGLGSFALVRSNEARSKAHSSIYKDFLNKLILPNDYIEEQYRKNRVEHFYTENEIDSFRSKWVRTIHKEAVRR